MLFRSSSLKGKIAAARFADGTDYSVARGRASLRKAPSCDAAQETELLFGETFTVYEEKDGWAWGQAALDAYVGYVHTIALGTAVEPDHRVVGLMTPVLSAPDVKAPLIDMLPMNALVRVAAIDAGYAMIGENAHVYAVHLRPLTWTAPDWVGVAERFVGCPYVWGGKTHCGFDCSGLVQTALQAGGVSAPRDTDMMERELGSPVADGIDVRRGDLVFWKGHMGVMLDGARLLHANAHHMEVAIEPLADARTRIAETAGAVTSIRRL